MTGPKTFTGPEGYTFTLYADGPRPCVIIGYTGMPLDHGTFVPLSELRAFVESLIAGHRGPCNCGHKACRP